MVTSKLAFCQGNKQFHFNFSAERITSDGGLLLLNKLIRNNKMTDYFADHIPDSRHPSYTKYSTRQLLLLRTLLMCCGYEDCNDINHLEHDPALEALFPDGLPDQSTLSRWENSMNIGSVLKLAYRMIDYYVDSLDPRQEDVVIDVDCTDDPTHGNQQGTLFHGFYWQWMYNVLFYIDGTTGQVILPVLRPGNAHSARWNERFLDIILKKIKARYPHIHVHLRADAGFSSPKLYECVKRHGIGFCVGITSNSRLYELIEREVDEVKELYVEHDFKHQRFIGPFLYKAKSWKEKQKVYAKVESTGKGLNIRFYVSNYRDQNPEKLYKDFYVMRGETAENRIKDIKNFCFADRLSCHKFSANFFRLIISCLAYETLRKVKTCLPKVTKNERIQKWSIQSIRLYLIKVAALVRITVRRVYFRFAKGHPYQKLITQLLL